MEVLEQVLSKRNMHSAYKAVWKNHGSAGVDGMELDKLMFYLSKQWDGIKTYLQKGKYYPQPVLGVYIEKFIKDKLHLEVNKTKSAVCRPHSYQYLSFAFVSSYERGKKGIYQLVVPKAKFNKLKQELKYLTKKTIPMSFDERIKRINQKMYGWINYFHLTYVELVVTSSVSITGTGTKWSS